jgi:hypothetical protein
MNLKNSREFRMAEVMNLEEAVRSKSLRESQTVHWMSWEKSESTQDELKTKR